MISAHRFYAAYCHPSRGDHMPLVGLAIVFVVAPLIIAAGFFADQLIVNTDPPVIAKLRIPT